MAYRIMVEEQGWAKPIVWGRADLLGRAVRSLNDRVMHEALTAEVPTTLVLIRDHATTGHYQHIKVEVGGRVINWWIEEEGR